MGVRRNGYGFRFALSSLAVVLAVAGIVLLVIGVGWAAGIGVVLMLWGNNIGLRMARGPDLVNITNVHADPGKRDPREAADDFVREMRRRTRAGSGGPLSET